MKIEIGMEIMYFPFTEIGMKSSNYFENEN